MGLDNIPRILPCKKAGTAIFASEYPETDEHNIVDCEATIQCGGCPYKQAYENDPLVMNSVPAYGIFGTPCWYRGKWGNSLLHLAASHGYQSPVDFYGVGKEFSEDQGLDPELCLELSGWMADHTEAFSNIVNTNDLDPRFLHDWIYASWWLKFVSKYGDGSAVWY